MDRTRWSPAIPLPALLAAALLVPATSAGESKLVDTDGKADDLFGGGAPDERGGPGIALDGVRLVVGAMGDNGSIQGADVGSATVFAPAGPGWLVEQKLGGASGSLDRAGAAVATGDGVIVLGAPTDDSVGGSDNVGTLRVYRWTGTFWDLEETLFDSQGTFDARLGWSVASSGDRLAGGAPLTDVGGTVDQGVVTTFRDGTGGFVEEDRLTPAGGSAGDSFGDAVALDGDVLVGGASLATVAGNAFEGSATVFRWNGTSWTEEQTLTAPNGSVDDRFGRSLALAGDVLVAGIPRDDVMGDTDRGSAFVFRWDGATWNAEQRLRAAGGAPFDAFGTSVAVDGDLVAVGAPEDDVGGAADRGSVTIFRFDGASWVEDRTLLAPDGAAGDGFGATVALAGEVCAVGAPLHDTAGLADRGAAYVFDLAAEPWPDQGGALPGVFGEPVLLGCGPLTPGSENLVDLFGAAPDAPAALFFATSSDPVAFKGGTLVPFPIAVGPFLITTDASGAAAVPFTMPPGVPAGTELWLQWALADAAAIVGVSMSNAVRGVTP